MVEKKLFTITPGKEPQMVLLIVDAQNDFIEGGALPVTGARDAMNRLAEYIKNNYQKYSLIAFTADWHPQSHCSFTKNKGQWPTHCVQFSNGAAIYQPLLDVLETCPHFEVLTKGCAEDHEEYSIFKNEESRKKLIAIVEAFGVEEIHVGGEVYEFCVADTVKDGLRYLPNVNFKVFKDFCPVLDKERADEFTKFIDGCDRVELI